MLYLQVNIATLFFRSLCFANYKQKEFKMGESADSKLRRVLTKIAKIKNIEFKDISSFLINNEWNEFKSRNNFFEELN